MHDNRSYFVETLKKRQLFIKHVAVALLPLLYEQGLAVWREHNQNGDSQDSDNPASPFDCFPTEQGFTLSTDFVKKRLKPSLIFL